MSDQDFFFDEDEQPTKTEAKAASTPVRTAVAASPVTAQSVSMAVASLIGVIALLAGVIVGILLPVGGTTATTTGPTATAPAAGGGTGSAPQLSPDELNSGQLPEGHPDIGAIGGTGGAQGSGGTQGSKETTTKK